jgi:hypothetical protein
MKHPQQFVLSLWLENTSRNIWVWLNETKTWRLSYLWEVLACPDLHYAIGTKPLHPPRENEPIPEPIEYSAMEQMQDQCDAYMEIHDAIAEDNDLLYAILRRAEVEMRYAGWDVRQEDNYGRYEVYNRIQEVLKGEEISDAESHEPVESNDLQGFISVDYSHILVYPKGSYPEGGVDLYTAPPKREWVGLTDEDVNATVSRFARYELARAIEAKLKEKNA